MATNENTLKLGLVLEGGGVKGAYQAGALKAICEAGYDFSGVSGTSIGAINGALYLEGGIEKVMDVWDNMHFTTIFDVTDEEIAMFENRQIAPVALEYIKRRFEEKATLINASYQKSQSYFYSVVNEDVIRASGKDFGIVTFNISEFKPVEIMMKDIDSGKLIDYVIASANFPGFPPKVIDGKKHIDGGIYDNLPINLLSSKGYDKMLVIRTNPMTKEPKRKIERDGLDIRYIAPSQDLGFAMRFSASRVHNFLKMGYDDATIALQNGLDAFLKATI